jgi:hypothetical protein
VNSEVTDPDNFFHTQNTVWAMILHLVLRQLRKSYRIANSEIKLYTGEFSNSISNSVLRLCHKRLFTCGEHAGVSFKRPS